MQVLTFVGGLLKTVMGFLAKLGPLIVSYIAGKRGEALDNAEAKQEVQSKIRAARDRVRSDPDFRERVRERFRE